ncbi:cytosolic endo-beta-N-acetylglucosaminidase-like isoform X1 [Cimex lectularius]|uniref:Cytosolic endo-beta-N-acetylglucosaminidase TIM barrel domain-containing protein n=2 Tax=Cimex lectularius TaxID=79782 RepID=A0A8I6RFZ1_CIMLE|nr:cytosolic endo-beta-N-acetylglucosaminidase-like isoform X1 [Cimex lectularius]
MSRNKKTKTLTVVIEERRNRIITQRVDPSPEPKPQKVTSKKSMCDDREDICQPISSLEGILQWKPPSKQSWAEKVIPKLNKSSRCFKWHKDCKSYFEDNILLQGKECVPKTLYCHDMKGGYLDDKYVKGCASEDPFTFFRWAGIDIFVYFSHTLLTIPPLAWINAAHANGVTVLGTIITEGEKGHEFCKNLLKEDKLIESFCVKVAQIAKHYKFSGYLLNIENDISMANMPNFIELVKELRKQLKKVDPNNIVIWYDSVTIPNGEICYQNELNGHNCTFFDITDGIFLNYNWKEENLTFSKRFAENRAADVFVGIDVFGRGCYGGGGFNSHKAMKLIRKYNLSAAIFAPGWVHECQTEDDPFIARDFKFWQRMYPYLFVSGPKELPFKTSFCTGFGKNYYSKGQIYTEGPWYNLSRQDFQLTDIIPWEGDDSEYSCLTYYHLDAYHGGNSVLLKSDHFERLFFCDFKLNSADALEIILAIKNFGEEEGEVEVLVKYIDRNSVRKKQILDYSAGTDEANHWRKRKFIFGPCEGTVLEIGCRLMDREVMLIGEVIVKKALKDSYQFKRASKSSIHEKV